MRFISDNVGGVTSIRALGPNEAEFRLGVDIIAIPIDEIMYDTWYNWRFVRVAQQQTLSVDGGPLSASYSCTTPLQFDCVGANDGNIVDYVQIKNVKLDAITRGFQVEYNIDSGETASELADVNTSSLGAQTITYQNIVAGDWS